MIYIETSKLSNHSTERCLDINLTILSEAIFAILELELAIPSHVLANPAELWSAENAHLLERIKNLDLRGLNLMAVPSEIGKLSNLKDLDLSDNQITSLPKEMSQLTQLIQLSLNNNQIAIVPTVIYELTSLRGLYLSNNQITQLDSKITHLENLKWLYLDSNPINQVPLEVYPLFNKLQTICIDNNPDKQQAYSANLALINQYI